MSAFEGEAEIFCSTGELPLMSQSGHGIGWPEHARSKPSILPSSGVIARRSDKMKIPYITIAAVLVGAALGAMGSEALKAQVPPAAFVVGEIDVVNSPAYFMAYVPVAAKAVVVAGGKYVV